MADESIAGALSVWDCRTQTYRILKPIPIGNTVGSTFQAWKWGEAFAHVIGRGPICKNADIARWLEEGLIERVGQPVASPSSVPKAVADAVRAPAIVDKGSDEP